MAALADADDVAHQLGLPGAGALTVTQQLRIPSLLSRASHLIQQAADRQFIPDTYTVRLKVNGGNIRLPESPINAVHSVTDDDGDGVEYTRIGQWLTVDRGSHVFLTITYTGGSIPDVVTAAVADIAARYLTVDPQAAAGATQVNLTTGPFQSNIRYADWATKTMRLSDEDQVLAESFRYQGTQVIVMQP